MSNLKDTQKACLRTPRRPKGIDLLEREALRLPSVFPVLALAPRGLQRPREATGGGGYQLGRRPSAEGWSGSGLGASCYIPVPSRGEGSRPVNTTVFKTLNVKNFHRENAWTRSPPTCPQTVAQQTRWKDLSKRTIASTGSNRFLRSTSEGGRSRVLGGGGSGGSKCLPCLCWLVGD